MMKVFGHHHFVILHPYYTENLDFFPQAQQDETVKERKEKAKNQS